MATSPSSTQSSSKSTLSNMRSLFRNRRANSESGDTRRPGPEEAGPSRANSRPAPIQEDTETVEARSPPINIPGQTGAMDIQPPNYISQTINAPIPSYEVALSQSPTGTTPRLGGLSLPQSPPARSGFLDYRISGGNGGTESVAGRSSASRGCAIAEDDDTDEDDPLVPRFIRPNPALNLIPLPQRRATFGGSERRPPSPSSSSNGPLPLMLPVEVPPPPANALPAYSPHLLRDELRLISAVHLDRTHPAAAFFNNLATNFTSPGGTQRVQPEEVTTGGKKLKVTLTKGAERVNANGTGPVFIRLPRGGEIAGRVEVGKVDHATRLEIAIIGLVNTSYYIRGQYTLIDTLPLCRRMQVLYPTPTPEPESSQEESTVTISADGVERHTGPATQASASGSGPAATATGNSNGPSTSTSNGTAPIVLDNAEIGSSPPSQPVGKDGLPFMTPGQKFDFNLKMPNHHYRESNIELPPTASIFQVGMQAGVEYVLRIKMSRKGWRLNETITIPIIYEPRAYVSPRRLRALTTDDAMNPGWRTIKLHGGDPTKPATQPVANPAQGVDVSLLLPSPPIVYVPWGGQAPPIPFHLHFHSSLPHALATFSDPSQCHFVIRLMRVATMRIGTEREIRRMEVPAKVEIWQEGGPRIVLGDPHASANGTGPASRVQSTTASQPSAPTASGSGSGSGVSTTSPTATTGSSARRPSTTGGETRRQSFLRRLSIGSESRESTLQRQNSNVSPATPVAPVAELPETSIAADASSTAAATPGPTTTTSTPLAPIPDEEDPTAPAPLGTGSGTAPSTESHSQSQSQSPLAPLSLSSTDVHFLGQLTISYPASGPELLRRLVQSFMTPEIGITYVLEVGLQPNGGSVKEAFKHVWGGGMVEIVLGARPDSESAGT